MLFVLNGCEFFLKAAYPIKYEEDVRQASRDYEVEKELIYAIIKCESGFDENAHSQANAIGLMQITPDTFKWLQLYTHEKTLGVQNLKESRINIKYGTFFVSLLRKEFESDDNVLCAYNAGRSVVKRWLNDKSISPDGKNLSVIPYKETRDYVKKVKAAKKIYKKLYFK